ncbi:hypothetical protein KJ969_01400 [Patescibacteria group bacterium]|nr:hypothetical protein [Patescibacteria group bacterium]MBU1922559.1 hypothetical protein [Patescibacteria group bacterium]
MKHAANTTQRNGLLRELRRKARLNQQKYLSKGMVIEAPTALVRDWISQNPWVRELSEQEKAEVLNLVVVALAKPVKSTDDQD